MRYFLINERTPFEIRTSLERFGCCIPLPAFSEIPEPVSRHPDMLIAKLDDTLFVHREYQKGQEILASLGVPFIISETPVGKAYPEDVRLNCFTVGNCLFAKENAASAAVLAWAKENGKTLVPVKQGYAKCATVVAGGAIATADKSIFHAAEKAGVPALLFTPYHIDIDIYDTGFLGGACGEIDEHTLGFFGKIEELSYFSELQAFFSQRGVNLLSLSEKPLFDFGGMITLTP